MTSAYRAWRWLQRVLLSTLPNKMALARDRYFVVQNIYRGRALFGIVLFGVRIANPVLALQLRDRGTPLLPHRAFGPGMSATWRG
jgi:hypothetical protein